MARKKEIDLDIRNRAKIAEIAKKIFLKYGYENTLMNDIAKEAEISKSTLYVYFKSKEEIRNYISLEAMKYFYEELKKNVQPETMDLHTRYMTICAILVCFKEKYPLSFQLIVEEICVDDEILKKNAILAEIYDIGEKINQFIQICFQQHDMQMKDIQQSDIQESGVQKNEIRPQNSLLEEKVQGVIRMEEQPFLRIMEQWGSIYGIITLADRKTAYLMKNFGVTKEEFLKQSFENLYLGLLNQ